MTDRMLDVNIYHDGEWLPVGQIPESVGRQLAGELDQLQATRRILEAMQSDVKDSIEILDSDTVRVEIQEPPEVPTTILDRTWFWVVLWVFVIGTILVALGLAIL